MGEGIGVPEAPASNPRWWRHHGTITALPENFQRAVARTERFFGDNSTTRVFAIDVDESGLREVETDAAQRTVPEEILPDLRLGEV